MSAGDDSDAAHFAIPAGTADDEDPGKQKASSILGQRGRSIRLEPIAGRAPDGTQIKEGLLPGKAAPPHLQVPDALRPEASAPSRLSTPNPAVVNRWLRATVKVETAIAMRDAALRKKVEEKVTTVDMYATKVVQSTLLGGLITLSVWAGTLAYLVVLAVQYSQQPATKTVGTEWTIGAGPFYMDLVCKARSGCLISNGLTFANTLGANALIPAAQTACFRVGYEERLTTVVVFSVDPVEGLSVMWDPTSTNGTTSISNGGLTVISQIRCPGNPEKSCVFELPTPVGFGTALLQHVDTVNDTAGGEARHRREWFVNMISQDGTPLDKSTPCIDTNSPLVAPATWVQARLRMNSFYNTVEVSKDSFWLYLFGAVGGAYAIFLQIGALLLATFTFLHGLVSGNKSSKVAAADSADKSGKGGQDSPDLGPKRSLINMFGQKGAQGAGHAKAGQDNPDLGPKRSLINMFGQKGAQGTGHAKASNSANV